MLLLPLICERCRQPMTGAEEVEAPYHVDGETWCDDCYDEWFSENSTECPLCCNWHLDEDLSEYFLLFEAEEGLATGFYKWTNDSIYTEPPRGRSPYGRVWVRRVGFLPHEAQWESFDPCVAICLECIEQRLSGRQSA